MIYKKGILNSDTAILKLGYDYKSFSHVHWKISFLGRYQIFFQNVDKSNFESIDFCEQFEYSYVIVNDSW